MRNLNRELMGNIITQQCAFYQFQLEETKVNIYGEAAEEKYYNGPYLFNCLINRSNQDYALGIEGVQFDQPIEFYLLRDDLVEKDIVPLLIPKYVTCIIHSFIQPTEEKSIKI